MQSLDNPLTPTSLHPAGQGDGSDRAPIESDGYLRASTIMMVDDDPLMLETVQTLLEDAGYSQFVMTSDPSRAIELAEMHQPDALLLDLMMPQLDGFQILERLRANDLLRFTPVIILTAENDAAAKLRVLELGATDFLLKPVDASELRLRLRNVLAFKAYQDQRLDFDALTGLLARDAFREAMAEALQEHVDAGTGSVLLHVDLDRFKKINETLGHRGGDRLLCEAANSLQRIVNDFAGEWGATRETRGRVLLSRLGGNAFALFLPELHALRKADVATRIARRIQTELAQWINVDGNAYPMSCSIGIAASPGDGKDAETLLKHAEVAMYQAKQRGRNQAAFFSSSMNAQALASATLEADLRRALANEEFILYYQPKVDVRSGRIAGVEALVRWKHPEHGVVPPWKFIPLAEEIGLISDIGQWVLRAACQQMRVWDEEGMPELSLSVNVSSAQFAHGRAWQAVQAALAQSRLPAQRLTLELTETLLLRNDADTLDALHELKEMGVKLSIDDFGTGYSSLSYLSRFPIDELKIDRSFMTGVTRERQHAAIVSAIVALGSALNLNVVAEGVEDAQQLAFLRTLKCQQFQGYLCSRPVPPQAMAILLRRDAQRTSQVQSVA